MANAKHEPLEKQLWKAVDKLRKNIDAAEYKHMLGLYNFTNIEKVREPYYLQTLGRYVGLVVEEDDFNSIERFTHLQDEFNERLKEEYLLNNLIEENLQLVNIDV